MSRLAWRCRRGMRELDELLQHYLAKRYPQATDSEQQAFERLLETQDPVLQAYLIKQIEPENPEFGLVIRAILRP